MLLIILPFLILFAVVGLVLTRWRARYQKQIRIRRLRSWAMQSAATDPALRDWLRRMPSDQLEVLLDLLDGYCVSLKWQLDWLFAPQIQKAPALHAALEESVNTYARTILLSLQVAQDVDAYQAYLAFDKRPHAHKQRALVQQLYAKIRHEHAAPAVQGIFRRFSRQTTTHKEQVAAIRQAFTQDPARTMVALKEILATAAPR